MDILCNRQVLNILHNHKLPRKYSNMRFRLLSFRNNLDPSKLGLLQDILCSLDNLNSPNSRIVHLV